MERLSGWICRPSVKVGPPYIGLVSIVQVHGATRAGGAMMVRSAPWVSAGSAHGWRAAGTVGESRIETTFAALSSSPPPDSVAPHLRRRDETRSPDGGTTVAPA